MSSRMVNRLDELAQNVPPTRDLWPAIAQAIEAESMAGSARPASLRRTAWKPVSALAAALALVTLGVFIGRSIGPAAPTSLARAGSAPHAAGEVLPASFARDEKYRQTRELLLSEVQNRLSTMPALERDKVGASLATLRRSISEIEAALGRDPANALLQELLVSSCQEEMRALAAVRDAGSQES